MRYRFAIASAILSVCLGTAPGVLADSDYLADSVRVEAGSADSSSAPGTVGASRPAAGQASAEALNAKIEKLWKTMRPGYHNVKILVDGVKRRFKVYIPKSLRYAANAPLVIVLHGALCSSNTVRWSSAMSVESEKRGFIVVYPNGLSPGFWNAGGICSVFKWRTTNDVKFISSVIDYSIEHLQTDKSRTFVAGVSNGAMMAYRLACELPEKIAAVAPVNGAMVCTRPETLKTPVSVVAFNGERDRVVRLDGKTGRWLFWKVRIPAAQSTIDYWAQEDHCLSQPQVDEQSAYTKELFTAGKNGTEVCWYVIKKSGHTWPGGRLDRLLHPITSHEFSVTAAMCDFFADHAKQVGDNQPPHQRLLVR